MNELYQPELPLENQPKTDLQRWSRLIPEHFHALFLRKGWGAMSLEQIASELKIDAENPLEEAYMRRLDVVSHEYDDVVNVSLSEVLQQPSNWMPEDEEEMSEEESAKLQALLDKLGCKNLYDIFVVDYPEFLEKIEADEDIRILFSYLSDYNRQVVKNFASSEEAEDL
jgi:hypothetical protein